MPHIGQCSATEFIPPTKHSMRKVRMIWPVERRAQPERPIKAFGNWRFIHRNSRILGPDRAVRPIVDLAQSADCASINPIHDCTTLAAWPQQQTITMDIPPDRAVRPIVDLAQSADCASI